MPDKPVETPVAERVELIIRQLESLSTSPCVAARFLAELVDTEVLSSELVDIIESAPALTVKVFSLVHEQGLSLSEGVASVRRAVGKLSARAVRDAILSVKVNDAFEAGSVSGRDRNLARSELALHNIAAACCAKEVAEIASSRVDPQMAYSAGLLHDVGKLALDQAMPKSFGRIVEEAKSQNCSTCVIEREYLGLDHARIGKRLAQRWHLPSEIALAIWLHHSAAGIISQNMPETRIAEVVQLADIIARQCDIGQSGNYESPGSAEAIALSLGIEPEQLERIRGNLGEQVRQKSEIVGLDLPNPEAAYCKGLQTAATQLARNSSRLFNENRRLGTASSHLDFIRDFVLSVESNTPPIDIAEDLAVRWQRFYQTGKVCIYLVPAGNSVTLRAVIAESLGETTTAILKAPAETFALPQAVQNGFAILDAQEHAGWLFEQLEVDFDPSQTKLVPLLSKGRGIGAIVFELRYPGDCEQFAEEFKVSTSVAGPVLDMAFAWSDQQRLAEEFVQLLSKSEDVQKPSGDELVAEAVQEQMRQEADSNGSLVGLADMAAGAAHELNNPLSVISGRAQLLAQGETDAEKKQMLKQIQENAHELSRIMGDLMTFARPQKPRLIATDVKQIIDEAVQLTSQKTKADHINVQIEVTEGLKNVIVDSAQIVSAVANVICNALESYGDTLGPIRITADADESGDFVKVQVSDLGCGMDAETLEKATHPFFSAKPAGRERGMGLSYARRFIELNKGRLEITSEPGSGTTVAICLPCK